MSLSNQFQVMQWAKELSQIPAGGLTDMWARIQNELSTVINMDVNNEVGVFYGGSHSQEDVMARLKAQGVDYRFTIDGIIPYVLFCVMQSSNLVVVIAAN